MTILKTLQPISIVIAYCLPAGDITKKINEEVKNETISKNKITLYSG